MMVGGQDREALCIDSESQFAHGCARNLFYRKGISICGYLVLVEITALLEGILWWCEDDDVNS